MEENSKLKKLVYVSLVFNAIVLIGLVMHVIHYAKLKQAAKEDVEVKVVKPVNGTLAVAYVNVDSLIEQYALVKDLQVGFEAERVRMEQEFAGKKSRFENEVKDFQSRASSMSASDAERLEKQLGAKQQQLYMLQEQYTNQLSQKEMQMKQHITDSIVNFLNQYYKKKYDYVLGYTNGGGILYANDSYNITSVVLQSLNKQYSKKKEK